MKLTEHYSRMGLFQKNKFSITIPVCVFLGSFLQVDNYPKNVDGWFEVFLLNFMVLLTKAVPVLFSSYVRRHILTHLQHMLLYHIFCNVFLFSYFIALHNTKYLKNTSLIQIVARTASFEEFVPSDQCWVLI